MRFLRPRIDEATALRLFQAKRGPWFLRPFRRDPSHTTLGRPLELVWLPWYLVRMQAFWGTREGVLTVSVQAHSRAFAIFALEEHLVEGEPVGETFPARLSEEEARFIGRRDLEAALMRRRNSRKKPTLGVLLDSEMIWYPYWVNYFQRARGFLDMRLLDAVNGERPGGRIKTALFDAFVQAARTRRRTP